MEVATITAFKFDTPDGAQQMLDLVIDLAEGQWITLQDAAIVTWPQGKQKPKPKCERSWLWPDLLAGLTVAALAVPKSLGSVGVAGVPIH